MSTEVRNQAYSVKKRLTVVLLSCFSVALLILLRAGYIQFLNQPRLSSMAQRQFLSHSLVRPRRGSILDRNGEPLAISVEVFSLAANPGKISKKRELARLIARATDLSFGKALVKLQEDREFVWIKRHLSENELKKFKKWRIMDSDGDLVNGLWLVKESKRVYPHKQLASHVLGDVNIDSDGIEGAELWFNEALRGKVVSVSAVRDALGRPTFIDAEAAGNVRDGESVTLSIDSGLQYEVERKLQEALRKTQAKSGTVIAMNASSGEILALANEPGFDPNLKGIPSDRRRNRALTDGYEPGSTLKSILLASALGHGWKLSDQVWGELGSFQVQNHRISEAMAHEKFEWVSLKKMLQVSSNVAAAKVALKLGPDRYLRTLRLFGFGLRTGSGFPGEISGKILPRKEWQPLALANIGFGQGILVTPMQMTRAYAALVNGGWLVKPSFLNRSNGEPIRIISARVGREVLTALEAVVQEGGTGVQAALPGYTVAGKTGTAQVIDPRTGHYSKEKYVASFIGFAVGVEPKVVIFVSLTEPKGLFYGSETAAPLFREVLASVANRLSLPPKVIPLARDDQPKTVVDQLTLSQGADLQDEGVADGSTAPDKLTWQIEPASGKPGWILPSLVGLSPREATGRLEGHGFRLEVAGMGVVSAQVPAAGKKVAEGDVIRLLLTEP
ncbi:MAG: PASTA domain-containing protein [Bdellovibrio sp.]|nr:PASTA domain-containing protein [Bdellovibrio sp.]